MNEEIVKEEVTTVAPENVESNSEAKPERKYEPRRNNNRPQGDRRNNRRNGRDQKEDDGLIKKLIAINRVTKVVKGGRTMRFSALVVCGDGNGKVGIGMAKAGEVPQAIEKATARAKNDMTAISLKASTIPHEIIGKYGRGYVLLIPAEEGTGVIAGGPVRNVLEACGIKDIRTKSYGTSTPVNCAKATLEGLRNLRTAEQIAALRGKTLEQL